MVTIRESPRAHLSPDKNTSTTQWPPRSPFQALLSSPSGRRKWQDRRNREEEGRNVSPSPGKRRGIVEQEESREEEDDEDEDEEMLQLKLQAIEAKLKLKKLRKAKKDAGADADAGECGGGSTRVSSRADSSPRKSPAVSRSRVRETGRGGDVEVEVPLSPVNRARTDAPKEQLSPARARLGLNALQKADGVSLKRARDGTQLKSHRPSTVRDEDVFTAPKPSSFSERLARSKVEAQEQKTKQERVERVRSTGFGRETPRPALLKSRATGTPASERPASAHQLQSSGKLDRQAGAAKSLTTHASRPERRHIPRANGIFTAHTPLQASASAPHDSDSDSSLHIEDRPSTAAITAEGKPASSYDPISQTHLSKRHIPHTDVAREMSGKELYTLPRLLKEVKAPHYDAPDCEADFVVFAILAGKSSPFEHQRKAKASADSDDKKKDDDDDEEDKPRAGGKKFMVLHLTDLHWDLDCFLFGTAFSQFWKLTPGTLLAILNPGILPPKGNQNSGRFSLKLASSEDCVMEIGVARDLGYCASVKKDGKMCGVWVDKRKAEVCEWHLDMLVERERKGRMEVNGMWRSHQGKGSGGGTGPKNSGGRKPRDGNAGAAGAGSYHREYGQLYSVPGGGASTAHLLDAEDKPFLNQDEEASRKRIAAAQRERDLRRDLAALADHGKGGVGAQYLRATASSSSTPSSAQAKRGGDSSAAFFEKPSAASLGLLGNKASAQHLSPAKDRKRHFGLGALSATTGQEAMGWGGARKAGLLLPSHPHPQESAEKAHTPAGSAAGGGEGGASERSRSRSPLKKRARFALGGEVGVKVPGRESLGGMGEGTALVDGEEEGDELVIV